MDRGYNCSSEREAIESMVMDNYYSDRDALREAHAKIEELEDEILKLRYQLDCAEDDYVRVMQKREKFKCCPYCNSDLTNTIIL